MLYIPLDLNDVHECYRIKILFHILFDDMRQYRTEPMTQEQNDEIMYIIFDNMAELDNVRIKL